MIFVRKRNRICFLTARLFLKSMTRKDVDSDMKNAVIMSK
jgi:hypothetical protein